MTLGPTHEEVVTDLVRDLIKSYRQLPVTLYQIQTKFRDEARPRFGILRTREFLMKDAYSFDADLEQLNASYDAMYEAYCRIFDRCGIPYVVVEAESGPIGGDSSHEFMVPCVDRRGRGHPVRGVRLRGQPRAGRDRRRPAGPGRRRGAPRLRGRRDARTAGRSRRSATSSRSTSRPPAKLLVFLADGTPVAALIRGDHEANEAKIRRAFGAPTLVPADAATIEKVDRRPDGLPRAGRDQDPAGRSTRRSPRCRAWSSAATRSTST